MLRIVCVLYFLNLCCFVFAVVFRVSKCKHMMAPRHVDFCPHLNKRNFKKIGVTKFLTVMMRKSFVNIR